MKIKWTHIRAGEERGQAIGSAKSQKSRIYHISGTAREWEITVSIQYPTKDPRREGYKLVTDERSLGWAPTLELAKERCQTIEDYLSNHRWRPNPGARWQPSLR